MNTNTFLNKCSFRLDKYASEVSEVSVTEPAGSTESSLKQMQLNVEHKRLNFEQM